MELNVIFICVTVIIVSFFIFLIFRTGHAKSFRADTKFGKFVIGHGSAESDYTEPASKLVKEESVKEAIDIDLYKHFAVLLYEISAVVWTYMLDHHTDSALIHQRELPRVVNEQVSEILELIDKTFSQSSNTMLSKMTVKQLTNGFYETFCQELRALILDVRTVDVARSDLSGKDGEPLIRFEQADGFYHERVYVFLMHVRSMLHILHECFFNDVITQVHKKN